MQIIYISRVCSEKTFKKIYDLTNGRVGQQIQKYHKLIVDGLKNNDVNITVISKLQYYDKKIDINSFEEEEGIKYNYIKNYKNPLFKQLCFYFSTLKLILKHIKDKNTVIICDGLNIMLSLAAKKATKIKKCKNAVIVTDVPGIIMTDNSKTTFKNRCISKFNIKLINSFQSFIFLTEQMNDMLNKYHKPYIVIEGQVDINMANKNIIKANDLKKIFLYAGIISRKNGVDKLVQAFSELNLNNVELHLYGDGEYEETLKKICNSNQSIRFFGIKENTYIIEQEIKASVLVNPRPSFDEFTKYSFPSKIMEYMASGTPLLTTKLAGIPVEYFDYLYLLLDESIEGFKKEIVNLYNKTNQELNLTGLKAKEYVLKEKNNIIQAKNIISIFNKYNIDKETK